jgi:hypothetical protein
MKIVKAIILLMYLTSYVYAVHMMSIEPDRDVWGYMCVLIFLVLSIAGVNEFSKNSNKENKEE